MSASLLAHLPLCSLRSTVRRLAAADLQDFLAYRGDPELARYQGWSSMSEAEAAEFVDSMANIDALIPGEWIQLGIAEVSTDRLLGDIGVFLSADESTAEIGFTLAMNAQGKGIATEAVRATIGLVLAVSPAQSICAVTDAQNHASIRLLERLEFDLIAKSDTVFKGAPCTEFTYKLPRERRTLL